MWIDDRTPEQKLELAMARFRASLATKDNALMEARLADVEVVLREAGPEVSRLYARSVAKLHEWIKPGAST